MDSGATQRTEERKDYAEIRSKVRNGDLLLFQGRGLTSKLIRCITRSKYSHCGVAMWWQPEGCDDKRLIVMQAVRRGVSCAPASSAVDRYSGQVDWYRLSDRARSQFDLDRLFEMCLRELGKPFGVWGMIVYLFRWAFSKIGIGTLEGGTDKGRPRAMFCSWYVSHVFESAGHDLDPDHRSSLTSPKALAQSADTEYSGTLHYDEQTAAHRVDAEAPIAGA